VKVVFLDIDGVLNSHEYVRSDRPRSKERGGVMGIDPLAVSRLNRLLRATGAVVVVSSTWRKKRSRVELQGVLDARGFQGTVHGKTPDLSGRSPGATLYLAPQRGEEIRHWLEHDGAEVEAFVVLDDDGDMDAVRGRFIQTEFETGLTDADVDRAIAMLNGDP
jgi:hypothetical protein